MRPTPAGHRVEEYAELIRLGPRFRHYQATLSAEGHDFSISDERFDSVSASWWKALDQAIEVPAHTLDGLRAKAVMLEQLIIVTVGADTDDPRSRFALSLARDVLAVGRTVACSSLTQAVDLPEELIELTLCLISR